MLREMKSFGAGHKASNRCSWGPKLELSDEECHVFFFKYTSLCGLCTCVFKK